MYPIKANPSLNIKMSETDTNNTQWPLNQSAYQNVANDQVDWAALAQQWIHMKETCTTDQLLAAPPPPIISKQEFDEEQGEAPMEVEKDDELSIESFLQCNDVENSANLPGNWQPGWQTAQAQWRKSINYHVYF